MNEQQLRRDYLDLMKKSLAGLIYEDVPLNLMPLDGFSTKGPMVFIRKIRELGRDYPSQAHTAIGLRRLENLQRCISTVIEEDIEGDLIETGVFRGGAVIFMRAVLKSYGVTDRNVWAADSFEGMPTPDVVKYPKDKIWVEGAGRLAASLEEVQENISRYALLDSQVCFLKGWFRDTLPVAPIKRLAVLRLDGDLYESTMVALENLYPKLSIGGFVIVDDYHHVCCLEAINDYRAAYGITEEIQNIDGRGAFWRRER
jgi:hypothetical protein